MKSVNYPTWKRTVLHHNKELHNKVFLESPYAHIKLAKIGWNDEITYWSSCGKTSMAHTPEGCILVQCLQKAIL